MVRPPPLYVPMRQTGIIMRNLFTAAVWFALSISSAYAEPIERTYQAVMFVQESHATKVSTNPTMLSALANSVDLPSLKAVRSPSTAMRLVRIF